MHVFVSYSRIDQNVARTIADILRRKGISFFLDERDIHWGDAIDSTIAGAFNNITHLIVLLSPASIKSQWVAYEIGLAKGKKVHILPFLLHPSIEVPSFIADLNFKANLQDVDDYFTAAVAVDSPVAVDRSLRIAVIPKGESLEFWRSIKAGAEDAAAEFGTVTIDWKGQFRESDSAAQNLAIEDCVDQQYDGICVAAIHSTETRRAIERALGANIPVVVYDSGLEDETETVSYVATDNYSAGQRAGHKMAEVLGNEGRIAIVRYKTGSRSTEEREHGFIDAIRGYPDIAMDGDGMQISDDLRVISAVAEAIVTRHGDHLDGVFASVEFATSGVLAALRGSPRFGSTKVIGFDANATIVAALRGGELSALMLQDPHQIGAVAVKVMVSHLMGVPVQREYKVPCALATRENVNTPLITRLLTIPRPRGSK